MKRKWRMILPFILCYKLLQSPWYKDSQLERPQRIFKFKWTRLCPSSSSSLCCVDPTELGILKSNMLVLQGTLASSTVPVSSKTYICIFSHQNTVTILNWLHQFSFLDVKKADNKDMEKQISWIPQIVSQYKSLIFVLSYNSTLQIHWLLVRHLFIDWDPMFGFENYFALALTASILSG